MMSPAARRTAALVFMLAAWVAFGLRHAPSQAEQAPSRALVHDVAAVGVTVSDMDRAVNFYSTVLLFEKVSDVEVAGDEFERLQGVFGARARVVTMRLSDAGPVGRGGAGGGATASTTPRWGSATPGRACAFTGTRSGWQSSAGARTTGRSKSGSTTSSAPASASPRCARRPARRSSCSSI